MSEASELSPMEIIKSLDVAVIDESIAQLTDEIAALKALRKVAEARSRKPSLGNGRASSGGEPKPKRMSPEERCEFAFSLLQEHGPMSYFDIAERAGYPRKSAFWMEKALSKDSRFTMNADVVSLSNGQSAKTASSED